MHEIVLLGLNHKTADVELRECLTIPPHETAKALLALKAVACIHEVIVISTCNRVEILVTTEDVSKAIVAIKSFLADFNTLSSFQFEDACYVHVGDQAVSHIFRVAASLDSMMIGEPQILGQIKNAYLAATQNKSSGVILNRLLHRTFFVAKRVRTETGIGDHAVSISYAAIELGRKIFSTLETKKVLLVGAGEMAELAMEHLIRNRVGDILVVNRTFERGLELATRFKGQAIRFEEINLGLELADIVVSSTGAAPFVITCERVKKMLRKRRNRPLFFIDIAVPRDIDPQINRLNNCYVYDIDDLKGVVEENIEDRQQAALHGERIIDEAVIRFRNWYDSLDVVPTLVAMKHKLETIASAELDRSIKNLGHLSEEDREAIGRMNTAVVKKILHDPIIFLKKRGCHGDKATRLDFTRKLFNLDL